MSESPPQQAYRELMRAHPEFMAALEAMGEAARNAGPLDIRSVALVKLAYGIGAGLEGATHSQVARAMDAGCTKEELLQVALLAAPTIGFPAMVRGRCWVLEGTVRKKRPPKGTTRAPRT